MSLNILKEDNIEKISGSLLEVIKKEESKTKSDMKHYLNKTNLSDEEKVKEYASFSKEIFLSKINACLTTAQQYIISDEEIYQQTKVNNANIDLIKAQENQAKANKDSEVERKKLITKQIEKESEEIKTLKTKSVLATAETQVKINQAVAQTLTEARRNGADVTKTAKTLVDPATGNTILFTHLSFAAASALDTTKGLIGKQMYQVQQQGDSFKNHTKVQVAGHLSQQVQTSVSEGLTSIDGMMNSQKNIYNSLFPNENLFDTNYNSIG